MVLEELCEAKGLIPCVGLSECDILTPGQKQELLVERATRIREEEVRPTALGGVPRERAMELGQLRERLLDERSQIVEDNERIGAELGGAQDREVSAARSEENELAAAGIRLRFDERSNELRVGRLDEIDRALDAMEDPAYGTCALCGRPIPRARLEQTPETRICTSCAREAPAPRRAGPHQASP